MVSMCANEVRSRHPHLKVTEEEKAFLLENVSPQDGRGEVFRRWPSGSLKFWIDKIWDVNRSGDPVDPLQLLNVRLENLIPEAGTNRNRESGAVFGNLNRKRGEFIVRDPRLSSEVMLRVMTDETDLKRLQSLAKKDDSLSILEVRHDKGSYSWYVFLILKKDPGNPGVKALEEAYESSRISRLSH